MKPVDGDVHLSPLTQGPESVEDPLLISELKVLQKAQVDVEPHQLISEKNRRINLSNIKVNLEKN